MIATLALAGPAWAGGETAPLTKSQARQIPSATLKARVLRQLSDVLVDGYRPSGHKPRVVLSSLDYWTTPRPSNEPNVCQATSVDFKFAPVVGDPDEADDGDWNADTPVVVTDVAATTLYHVLADGADDMPGGDWRRGRRAKCARLVIDKTPFFGAEDAQSAARGAWLLARLRAAADQPAPGFAVECPKAETGCLASLKGGRFWSVDRCQGALVWVQCLALNVEDYQAQVTYSWKNGSLVVDRVKVDQMITLTHERRD